MHDGLWQLTYQRENCEFQPPLSSGSIPLWNILLEIISRKNQVWGPYRRLDVEQMASLLKLPHGEGSPYRLHPYGDHAHAGPNEHGQRQTLRPSTVLVIANFFVPSDLEGRAKLVSWGQCTP